MRRIQLSAKAVPIALLILCLLAFGPLIFNLGFYWDDWPTIWYLHFFGPSSFKESFAIDRPLLASVFMATTPLIGESTVGWQLFGILARWLSALTLWWMLRLFWPKHTLQATWIALLFAVYPGFRQQFISVTYSNGLIVFSAFLASFATMILALRKPQWYWLFMLLSLSLSAFTLFTVEYFFGLELLRPVILWLLQPDSQKNQRQRLRRVALQWAPYIGLMLLFLFWRLFLHVTPRGDLIIFAQLKQNPLAALGTLLLTILQDIFETAILAWLQVFNITRLAGLSPITIFIYALLVILTAGLAILFLANLRPAAGGAPSGDQAAPVDSEALAETPAPVRWGKQALLLGLFSLLISGWPIWVTDLHIELRFPWDRFTLSMMFGACLAFAGLIDLLIHSRRLSAIILGIVLGMSVGMHFQDALAYQQEWSSLASLFWQMSWRAPALKPGTTVLTSELPFTYYSDNSLTAPLNWTYAPEGVSRQMPYLFYDLEARLGSWLPSLKPDTPIQQPYRVASFSGSTSQAIVILYAPPRCLKVFDPIADRNLPYRPRDIAKAIRLSNLEFILAEADPGARPPAVLGEEPPHDWCYYFEKAELAAQIGDWEQVASLGNVALQLNKKFTKETASELTPFIRGYAQVGNWDKAVELSLLAYQAAAKDKDKMKELLCSTWYIIRETTAVKNSVSPNPDRQAAIERIESEFSCQLPE
jgi:hypothetical protein